LVVLKCFVKSDKSPEAPFCFVNNIPDATYVDFQHSGLTQGRNDSIHTAFDEDDQNQVAGFIAS